MDVGTAFSGDIHWTQFKFRESRRSRLRATRIARFVSTRSSDLLPASSCRCCKVPSSMPSLLVTMSDRLKSAMLKGATSCAAKFTALTGIVRCAMRSARARCHALARTRLCSKGPVLDLCQGGAAAEKPRSGSSLQGVPAQDELARVGAPTRRQGRARLMAPLGSLITPIAKLNPESPRLKTNLKSGPALHLLNGRSRSKSCR